MKRRNEFEQTSNNTLKSLLVKLFLIIVVLIVLFWLIPKFFLYKNSKKHDEIDEKNNTVLIKNSTVEVVENAGIKYFNEKNVPAGSSEKNKVALKVLQDESLLGKVKNNGVTCDNKNTYVELTKNSDYYVLTTYVKCGDGIKQSIKYLNNYSYCTDNYLCEKNEQKEKEIREQEEKQRNTQVPDTAVDDDETRELTEFGPWKNYHQVSCNKQEIKCDINNTNCLREVKVEVFKELIDSNNQIYKDVCYSSERTREYK